MKSRLPTEIRPNKGLGSILFGTTPDLVRSKLGEPDQVSDMSKVHKNFVSWRYNCNSCEFFFHEGTIFNPSLSGIAMPCLVWISASSSYFTLNGIKIVGESAERVTTQLAGLGIEDFKDVTKETFKRRIVYNRALYSPSSRVGIYSMDGIVTETEWAIPETGRAPCMEEI
jgi:hypothetical protein